ncbi:hypothetical protein GDO78_006640 [Eleutherodactylus coqui]|nr:hypothetical protein GDO78_006640 [Eleutherodactylus coqui]
MKYLYPYECEKRGLSNPNELQAAIDSNRREGRRQSFGGSLFTYSPSGAPNVLSSPKIQMPAMVLAGTATNGSTITPIPKIKKAEGRQDSAVNLTTNGTNSISMSVELNGIVYTGVLFAQPPTSTAGISKGNVTRTAGGTVSASLAPAPAPQAPGSNSSSP